MVLAVIYQKGMKAPRRRGAGGELRCRTEWPNCGIPLFWGGMRGVLALALALPPEVPHRDEIITVSFDKRIIPSARICHAEKYLESGHRGGSHHIPHLFKSLDGKIRAFGDGGEEGSSLGNR